MATVSSAVVEVQVLAEDAEDLALSHAGGKAEDDGGAEWRAAGGREKGCGLTGVENHLRPMAHCGPAYLLRHVPVDDVLLQSGLEADAQDGMDVVERRLTRLLVTPTRDDASASVAEQGCDVLLCEFSQGDIAEARDEVGADDVVVAAPCRGLDGFSLSELGDPIGQECSNGPVADSGGVARLVERVEFLGEVTAGGVGRRTTTGDALSLVSNLRTPVAFALLVDSALSVRAPFASCHRLLLRPGRTAPNRWGRS